MQFANHRLFMFLFLNLLWFAVGLIKTPLCVAVRDSWVGSIHIVLAVWLVWAHQHFSARYATGILAYASFCLVLLVDHEAAVSALGRDWTGFRERVAGNGPIAPEAYMLPMMLLFAGVVQCMCCFHKRDLASRSLTIRDLLCLMLMLGVSTSLFRLLVGFEQNVLGLFPNFWRTYTDPLMFYVANIYAVGYSLLGLVAVTAKRKIEIALLSFFVSLCTAAAACCADRWQTTEFYESHGLDTDFPPIVLEIATDSAYLFASFLLSLVMLRLTQLLGSGQNNN